MAAFELEVGMRVKGWWGHTGTVRFFGPIPEARNPANPAATAEMKYAGVEWDDPTHGKCDGSFNGKRLFVAPPNSCTFVTVDQLQPVERMKSDEKKLEQLIAKGAKAKELILNHIAVVNFHGDPLPPSPWLAHRLPLGLTKLSLCDDQLTEVPAAVQHMTNLTSLKLSRNLIATVPEFLCTLSTLRTLWLDCNRITALPPYLTKMTMLQELRIYGNAMDIPPAVLDRGIGSLFTYVEFTDATVQNRLLQDWKDREEQTSKETEMLRSQLRECFHMEREEAQSRIAMERDEEEEFLLLRQDVVQNRELLVDDQLLHYHRHSRSRLEVIVAESEARLRLLSMSDDVSEVFVEALEERRTLAQRQNVAYQRLLRIIEGVTIEQMFERMAIERGRFLWERDVQRQMLHELCTVTEEECERLIHDALEHKSGCVKAVQQLNEEWLEEAAVAKRELEKEVELARQQCQDELVAAREKLARQVREWTGLKTDCDKECTAVRQQIQAEMDDARQEVAALLSQYREVLRQEKEFVLQSIAQDRKVKTEELEHWYRQRHAELQQRREQFDVDRQEKREQFDANVYETRARLQAERRALTEQLAHVEEERALSGCSSPPQERIVSIGINVGGSLFMASKSTLCAVPENFFNSLMQSVQRGETQIPYDASGNIFVDRNPLTFATILSYLRYGTSEELRSMGAAALSALRTDCDFFGVPQLAALVDAEAAQRTRTVASFTTRMEQRLEIATRTEALRSLVRACQSILASTRWDLSRARQQCMWWLLGAVVQQEHRAEGFTAQVQQLQQQSANPLVRLPLLRKSSSGLSGTAQSARAASIDARLVALERDITQNPTAPSPEG